MLTMRDKTKTSLFCSHTGQAVPACIAPIVGDKRRDEEGGLWFSTDMRTDIVQSK